MPGIDYGAIRRDIPILEALVALGWEPTRRAGSQARGDCPVCGASRCFAVAIDKNRYHCHRCRSAGNTLELWMAARNLDLYPAAVDLCETLGRPIPTISRW